jgi:hypothetical protein
MIIGKAVLVASIASRLYDRFKAAGHLPVPDTFESLGMMVIQNRSKRSIDIEQIGYINSVCDSFERTKCRMRSTPMEFGCK